MSDKDPHKFKSIETSYGFTVKITGIAIEKKPCKKLRASPLKDESPPGDRQFIMPVSFATHPELTDRIYRLLSILLAHYHEGHDLFFQINDLVPYMNKSERRVRETISQAVDKGFIKTRMTGRGLFFELSEDLLSCKGGE